MLWEQIVPAGVQQRRTSFNGVLSRRNIDWMGKAKYFIALSLLLLAVRLASILRNHGLFYGIDFQRRDARLRPLRKRAAD